MAILTSSTVKNKINLTKNYQDAEKLLQIVYANKPIASATLFPVWVGSTNQFFYRRSGENNHEYRLVDAEKKANELAFDHAALANALAAKTGKAIDPQNLPITLQVIDPAESTLIFTAFDRQWRYCPSSNKCNALGSKTKWEMTSPDGKFCSFSRHNNLWLRDVGSGKESPLTTDGEEFFVYGAMSTGWAIVNGGSLQWGLQVSWSPDSKRVFVIQRDTRHVQTLPVVHHVPTDGSIRPQVEHIKVSYPGEEDVEKVRLLCLHIETGDGVAAKYRQIPTTRNGHGFFESGLGWWGKDSRLAYFVDVDRYYKYAKVVEFNTETGECRVLFKETTDTHINLMPNQDAYPTFLPLPESEEVIWYSERTGWGHLYLYDLKTGALKNPVTSGPGLVRDIVKYVPGRRELFVQMAGRVLDRDPYYRDLVRVNIDTGEVVTLASSDHEYTVITQRDDIFKYTFMGMGCPQSACGISPDGQYAVVTRSRADEVPVSFLVNREGETVMELETADISPLPQTWQWPEPVKLTAADGTTDIYGLVFRPSHFDPNKSYPVVSHGFNQPEIAWVSKGSFSNGVFGGWTYWDAAALAELGFIVVQIDGRGSPEREKAFLDQSYGWFESASNIDDHVTGIKQLAERYSYMDLERIGFTAHTSGGSGAVQALLKHPDFYKVGITSAYHDGRLMPGQMQGEKYDGKTADAHPPYPEEYVDQLQGKLLLMIGMLDTTTPPAATFRLVEALQKANKDFDMIMLPNLGHGGLECSYLFRRTYDYLVRHLMAVEPPKEFDLRPLCSND